MAQERGDGWTKGVHPDDLPGCIDTYVGAFDRREPFSMRYRLRRHDGEYRLIEDVGQPRYSDDDTFIGYIGSCLDVTELSRLEDEVALCKARIAELENRDQDTSTGGLGEYQ